VSPKAHVLLSIRIRVPATTANLGPGFDVLGMALGLWNEVVVSPARTFRVTVEGEGADVLPRDETNLVVRSMFHFARALRRSLPPVHVHLVNRIPMQAGLGSSSAAIVGGLRAAAAVLASSSSRTELLRLAVEIEGHPDNVAPAIYGGLVAVAMDQEEPLVVSFPVPAETRVVVALPDVTVSTEEARRLLPPHVPHRDAVFNVGRAILVVHALSRGDYALLARVMADRLHEPYRRTLIPGYERVVAAARQAGAAAVAISGSGPALIAFAEKHHERVAMAMKEAFARAGVSSRTWVLPVVRDVEDVTPM